MGEPPSLAPLEAKEIGPWGDEGGELNGAGRRTKSADGDRGDEGWRTSKPTLEMSLAASDEGGEAGGGAASRRVASRAEAVTRVRPDRNLHDPEGVGWLTGGGAGVLRQVVVARRARAPVVGVASITRPTLLVTIIGEAGEADMVRRLEADLEVETLVVEEEADCGVELGGVQGFHLHPDLLLLVKRELVDHHHLA